MKKNISKILITSFLILLLAGCGSNENKTTTTNNISSKDNEITSSPYDKGYLEVNEEDVEGMEKMTCTREATGENSSEVNLNYELYYEGEYLGLIHSMEEVVSEDADTLDKYETAYINIYKNYEDLEYYDTSVVRTSNSVTNDTIINYKKIDTNKLLEIEGEEDNIIKDGKVKLDDWLDFTSQFGMECE